MATKNAQSSSSQSCIGLPEEADQDDDDGDKNDDGVGCD